MLTARGGGLLYLLTNQRRREVDGEGEGGLLGALDDDAGLCDVLADHVLVFCDQLCTQRLDEGGGPPTNW